MKKPESMLDRIPKISVIIPIYNVEKYIERCVRSLMEQTLQEVEYIFVNDCTPDRSLEVLQRVLSDYPKKEQCVSIISHTVNKGVAAVRNTGLANARGEYVIYCDSDDWIEQDMYEAMYRKAKETDADIVVTDFYNEYATRLSVVEQPYPNDSLKCIQLMLSGRLHCGTCNKLVRKSLYVENHINFPNSINMWEDVLTTIPLCYHASNIAYIPKAYYHYTQFNENSYTQHVSENSLQNMLEAVRQLEQFLVENHLENMNKELCYMKLTVKLNLLLNSNGKRQKEWSKIYPEATYYIRRYQAMSFYWRIALAFSSWNLLPIFNIMAWIRKRVRI